MNGGPMRGEDRKMGYVSYLEDIINRIENNLFNLEQSLSAAQKIMLDSIVRESRTTIKELSENLIREKAVLAKTLRTKEDIERFADIATEPEMDLAKELLGLRQERDSLQKKAESLEARLGETLRTLEARTHEARTLNTYNRELSERVLQLEESCDLLRRENAELQETGWDILNANIDKYCSKDQIREHKPKERMR